MTYRSGYVVGTGREIIYPHLPETIRLVVTVTGGRARDVFMAGAQSGTALGIAFGAWLKEQRCLGAGLRLRAATRRLLLDAEDYRREELALMRLNFYGPDPTYHEARRRFVYKGTPPPHPADQPEQMRHAF